MSQVYFSVLRASLALVIVSGWLFSQAQSNSKSSPPPAVSLAKALDMGSMDVRLFENLPKVRFMLKTSWIPGEKRQGMFRYKLSAFLPRLVWEHAPNEPDEVAENLLKRVSSCRITLGLYDKDTFVLRQHVVPFSKGVDEEHARLQALFANDSFQLDAQEYREFTDSGSWDISWDCGFQP